MLIYWILTIKSTCLYSCIKKKKDAMPQTLKETTLVHLKKGKKKILRKI